LSKRIAIEVIIEQKHHRTIMGSGGSKVKQIQSDFNVDIKFPEKSDNSGVSFVHLISLSAFAFQKCRNCVNLYFLHFLSVKVPSEENEEGIKTSDIIRVSGRPENCEGAKQALLEQVPITLEVDIPFKVHPRVIGQKGIHVRELMKNYDVHITVPSPDEKSDTIKVCASFSWTLAL
jgi:predicted PilT family ATPase